MGKISTATHQIVRGSNNEVTQGKKDDISYLIMLETLMIISPEMHLEILLLD